MTTARTWTPKEEELHIYILEVKAVQLAFEAFQRQNHGRESRSHERQHHSGGVSKETWRDDNSIHVQTGSGHHRLARAAHGVHFSKVHPREKEHSDRPAKLTGSGHPKRMDPSSLGV